MFCDDCIRSDLRYKYQQEFIDLLGTKLGFVVYRPDYHRKKGDKNTVLLYTHEDAAYNIKVDRQPTRYSRSEAIDRYIPLDSGYVYRDYFWWFENSDANGHFSYDWANFGKLDLRYQLRWQDVLEGEIRIAFAKKQRRDYILKTGGLAEVREGDNVINNLNREVIKGYWLKHGKAFLGRINYYSEEWKKAGNSIYEPYYKDQPICNFACDFCVPVEDEELANMIRQWNANEPCDRRELIDKIYDRIAKLGGEVFTWS